MTIETMSSIEFPAVTICNENPILKSKISRLKKYSDFQALDKYTEAFLNYAAKGLYDAFTATEMECPEGFFKCEKDGFCIPEERKCDQVPHCSDGSDEDEKLNCETIEIGKSELCTGNYTECFDSSNVTICSKNCDGVPECAYEDDEDEKECGNDSKVRTATITPKVITSEEFPEKYQNDYIWSVIIKSYDCRASIVLKIHELYIEQDDEFRENGSILCYDYLLWFEGEKSTIDFQLNTKVDNGESILCGRLSYSPPKIIDTNSSLITLYFITDHSITDKGFKISYEADPNTPTYGSESDYNENVDDLPRFWTPPIDSRDNKFNSMFKNFTNYYYGLYRTSVKADYSDFRDAVTFDKNAMWHYGQKRSDFIVQCQFRGENCDMGAFEDYDDPTYGKCFTFKPPREVYFGVILQ
ncbi:uncharacterized protein LOC142356850, partial [Convolutriloba macropyga]|uniref:uncharacterized protein LOC142356850 n=1 Tax=Convolutriloba macropyga TaxID=536237 RepID=UPI003F51B50A